jgi:hypothetical protein
MMLAQSSKKNLLLIQWLWRYSKICLCIWNLHLREPSYIPDDCPVWPKHVTEFKWKYELRCNSTNNLWSYTEYCVYIYIYNLIKLIAPKKSPRKRNKTKVALWNDPLNINISHGHTLLWAILTCFLFIHSKQRRLTKCRLDDCYWILEIRIPTSHLTTRPPPNVFSS